MPIQSSKFIPIHFSRCKAKVCTMKGSDELVVINLEHNHTNRDRRRAKGELQKIKALRRPVRKTNCQKSIQIST